MASQSGASYSVVINLIIMMWLGFFASIFFPVLFEFGLYPRHKWGLVGIFTSPFLHGGWQHLIANTTGIVIFGGIFCWLVKAATAQIVFYIIVLQGLLTWIFAREGNHIGASGLVFGLFGYLLVIGFFERRLKHILVSALVMVVWGGTIVGILPLSPYVSWEAHLFGLIAGITAARIGLKSTAESF